MKKDLRIINIDGTEGSGKTTQVQILSNKLNELGYTVKTHDMEDTIESGLQVAKNTVDFLKNTPNGVVINDGSVARMIAKDMATGVPGDKLGYIYKDILLEHKKMYHAYGTANLLFVMDDVDTCQKRLEKEAFLLKKDSYKQIDIDLEPKVLMLLQNFDSRTITENLTFYTLKIEKENTIFEIRDMVFELLEKQFKLLKT